MKVFFQVLLATAMIAMPAIAQDRSPAQPNPPHRDSGEPVALQIFGDSQIFNTGNPARKVRVEYLALANANGRLKLFFEAASMDARCNLRGPRSAWLQLALTDGDGNPIGGFESVAVAAVNEAGGYQAYNNLDITTNFNEQHVNLARGFRVRMPGGVSC